MVNQPTSLKLLVKKVKDLNNDITAYTFAKKSKLKTLRKDLEMKNLQIMTALLLIKLQNLIYYLQRRIKKFRHTYAYISSYILVFLVP